MNMNNNLSAAVLFIAVACAPGVLARSVAGPADGGVDYSPYVGQTVPDQVFFGDTHLHTSYSIDAGMIGNTLGPADAYRFARGETVTSSLGVRARLQRPLDFLVVADHAEALGVAPMIARSDPVLLKYDLGRQLHDLVKQGTVESSAAAYDLWSSSRLDGGNELTTSKEFAAVPWTEILDAAEAANEPGRFTALIGYEWTGKNKASNLHRVVVYRDGKERANTRIPLSADLDPDPEALWNWMESYEKETGGRLLAIPHNGNLSNGLMFDDVNRSGEPMDAGYAERRQRLEPLYEVTQMKGDGEAHPQLSPEDEFADFETWDKGDFGRGLKTPDMLPREYAREALKRGLAYGEKLGANPFKFGMIGSSDAHTSLATTQEDNFFGKVAQLEPSADPMRFNEIITGRRLDDPRDAVRAWQTSASGLAAVWARENTREAIWDAMASREVYATTGTRLKVRVFAGWDFKENDLDRPDFARYGYARGVPMGGDLAAAPEGKVPGLLIRAMRDADGANLDRVQVIKGWLDAGGETQEKVYDVAWSGDREVDAMGSLPAVGNTVDVEQATYSNTIGEPFLQTFWRDPDFDPDLQAFYYVRVLEIPTPRWTTYDARIFGVKRPEGAPVSIQDRAYTSPIWYAPR